MARLLALVLPCLGSDEALSSLWVVGVEPAPDASRLRVRLACAEPGVDASAVLARLHAARGRIRAEIAAGVCRKRAPELVFELDRTGGAP